MDKIVLDVNLKFVLAQLSLLQRGALLSALFEGEYDGGDEAVANVFCYINDLQRQYASKKKKMQDMSTKSAIARKFRVADDELPFEPQHELQHELKDKQPQSKRKETKENNINKNNIFLFSESKNDFKKSEPKNIFVPPNIEEVRSYIAEHHLLADAETFINFYESHGWMVGSTPIKSWQATLKLWHSRNADKQQKKDDDEAYWDELSGRVLNHQNKI